MMTNSLLVAHFEIEIITGPLNGTGLDVGSVSVVSIWKEQFETGILSVVVDFVDDDHQRRMSVKDPD